MKEATSADLFNEPFYSAVRWIPEDSNPVFLRQLQYWPTVPWDNRGGRVTLIGDAAHCILPSKLPTRESGRSGGLRLTSKRRSRAGAQSCAQ